MLVDKLTTGKTGASVVGRDLGFRLNCGPEGDYFLAQQWELGDCKFRLQLEKPDGTLLLQTSTR